MLNKFIIAIFLFIPCVFAYAAPSPLGLEIGKATLLDMKDKYKIISSKENATKNYYNHYLNINNANIKGLTKALVITNDKDIVEVVALTFHNSKFDEIYSTLAKKYSVQAAQIPFVGNKLVELKSDDILISIIAPHMSFDMNVYYSTKNFDDLSSARIKQEEQSESRKTESML